MSERHPEDSTCGILTNNGWFTLGELLVSIAIVAVLSTVALLAYWQYADDAETSKARASAAGVETTIVAESTATAASPRAFITHVPNFAHSWSSTSVGGIPVTLLAGAYGENWTNYSAGYPDWNKLKLDPARFWKTAWMSDVLVGALDANANGRWSTSYTQTAVVAWKKYAITGTYPAGSASAVPGLIVSPKEPGKALVDGAEAGSLVCPPWFAKVPGNPEFPTASKDFCLAKYEMKYVDLSDKIQDTGFSAAASVAWGWRSMTWRYATWATITSKPDTTPVSWLTQWQAIAACASMGSGFHLVTNDEWMAAARNVESVADNWSGWSVGAGGLYAGNSMRETALTCDAGGGNYAAWTADYIAEAAADSPALWSARTSCDQKRQLKLSNWEILWDMSGNAWEHVNGANTIDGSWNAVFPARACSNTPAATIHEFSWTVASSYECLYVAPYSRETHWPKTPGMNASNGMWRMYHQSTVLTNDRIFMRWGNGHVWDSAGLYSLLLFYDSNGTGGWMVTFRCAYR